ncbi:DNA primase-like [Thermosinus carboxydivorans Nor1]|uniref:DNA primase-like n=1 Tax=Thermosinus carboxydivorans Nor1 TaxID=401526 RepID=A1HS48_9FIRM|nr:non-homologous end-joining DNA ligase [Thermosinus carboxydivorans]EAX47113.1 DNA primase-like [Thermosinus carboxydivorans Nor1]
MPSQYTDVIIEGVELRLSNLEKIFYPRTGFTKGQVIDYYVRIAPVLLPHLANRPLTLKRYPDGAQAAFFYQKQCPKHRPKWLKTAPVWSEHNNDHINFCLVNDLPSLVWVVNLATLELHTSLSLATNTACPTMMVFDLDPGPPATIIECAQVALWLKTFFDHQGLLAFPKTSGAKGLQVYVPLNTPTDYATSKHFAHVLAKLLEREHPGQVVSKMTKSLRTGKVLVDWSQNDEHKTTVCVYSLRAREYPTVSTPVAWEEVDEAWQKKDPRLLTFDPDKVLARVDRYGDLFAPVTTLKQSLPLAAIT